MKVTINYRHRGEQVRAYGPRQYDLTVKIEGSSPQPSRQGFERIAKANSVDWDNQPEGWYKWTLKHAFQIDDLTWQFIVELPYDD